MLKLDASKSGSFKIGDDLEVHRLGFGAMRITGPGIWGPPADRVELRCKGQADDSVLAIGAKSRLGPLKRMTYVM